MLNNISLTAGVINIEGFFFRTRPIVVIHIYIYIYINAVYIHMCIYTYYGYKTDSIMVLGPLNHMFALMFYLYYYYF